MVRQPSGMFDRKVGLKITQIKKLAELKGRLSSRDRGKSTTNISRITSASCKGTFAISVRSRFHVFLF